MTRIADLLAERRTVSFEFFPPRTSEAGAQLQRALDELTPLAPDFVSVTYGALGSTRETTRGIVIDINRSRPFPAMAHLTCVGHSRDDIRRLLDGYAEHGVDNILALSGDPPADGSDPGGEFTYAMELVELVRAHPHRFSLGVAAHPELHPRSKGDRRQDRRYLAEKLAAADFGITQFFFEPGHYWRMLDELADEGCTTPVLPGVMPIINASGVRRMAAMNASRIPAELEARLDAIGSDAEAVRRLGVEIAVALCRSLWADERVRGVHLYTLNRSRSVTEIVRAVGLR